MIRSLLDELLAWHRRSHSRRSWSRFWKDPRATWHKDAPRDFVMAGLADGWLSPGMRVLEIGCGLGHTGAWLARHGIEATAFDFAPEVIERARKLYPSEERLTLLVADACGPSPFSTTFDVILDTGCFHGIARSLHPRYRKNALAWSRPGTRFVMSMHTANVPAEERIEVVRELLCPPLEIVGEGRRPSFDGQRLNVILHLVRS